MRISELIAAKRDGHELLAEDISHFVCEYACGQIPDYQMSAFLMAAYIRGLSFAETTALTRAMIESGSVIDLSSVPGIKVDKHSTGGVGDKTTLVVVPVLAACGLKVAKMSGRGLGFTGGTLDKLESIPGFFTDLSVDRLIHQVRTIGAVMAGHSADIVPADKKIYALRDVTATVESIPLIAASVMSKKIACGSDVILLDVKVGSGAFVRNIESARELARTMIAIGEGLGRKVGAAITDMSQPLGDTVGNALEVKEAIDTLKGGGPADFRELCVRLSAIMLQLAGVEPDIKVAVGRIESVLCAGNALRKFKEIVSAQGGDVRVIDDYSVLPSASYTFDVVSPESGYVSSIDTAGVGMAASVLGAGRERKEDAIDPAAGLVVKKKLGDYVAEGDVIATLQTNRTDVMAEASRRVLSAYELGEKTVAPPLIADNLVGAYARDA